MAAGQQQSPQQLARITGGAMLATMVLGALTAFTVAAGIDINLTADVVATAENMLSAEQNLRGKAYLGLAFFGLEAVVGIGLFLLLRGSGSLLAAWCLAASLAAALLVLLGAVFALNAAEIAGDPAYQTLGSEQQRLLLTGLQATSDYTSFHLSLVLASAAKAGYYWLFLATRHIPALIAGWGLFASIFVATTIVARDFIPLLGHGGITAAFMISNLIAILTTGLYLAIFGVRPNPQSAN